MHLADNLESGEYSFDSQISVLDLGTGNGHLLFELNEELLQRSIANSFTYTGIDYSPDSVAFCKELAPSKYPNGSFTFDLVDLLSQDEPFLNNKFDIILDKGTLDAIALNQDPIPGFDKIGMDIYASQVVKMMSSKSILLVTSCNFTEDELIKIITSNTSLKVMKRIAYPSYEYNGVKGSTICSVSFQMS